MGKVVPLEELKSKEEYEDAKRKIEYYGKLYAWFESSSNPIEEIKNQVNILLDSLANKDLTNNDKKKILWQIHSLSVRGEKIQKGTYRDELRNTIMTNAILVKQYDEKENEKSLSDVIRDSIAGKINLGEYLNSQRIVKRINNHGLISNSGNSIEVESPSDIINQIFENYDLVGISNDKEETTSLLKVERPDYELDERDEELLKGIHQMTDNVIREYVLKNNSSDKTIKIKDNTNVDMNKHDTSIQTSKHRENDEIEH